MTKKTIVLGLGKSGISAAKLLLKQNQDVLGIDSHSSYLETCEELVHLRLQGMRCQHDRDPIEWDCIERVVVSPGVSPKHFIYQRAKEKSIEVIGEAELALPYFKRPMIAVTGTNGKTTVTLLIEHVLSVTGIKTKALGNVGTALCDYLMNPGDEEAFVVELSSFQLETMLTPIFDAAIILNITPDHLDRYADMEDYAKTKCRLQYLLRKDAPFFIQTQTVKKFGHLLQLNNYQTFGCEEGSDLWTDQTCITYRGKVDCIMPMRYREMGEHDHENVLAVWGLCQLFSISNEQFCKALETFQKPPHRIEFVCEIEGISFFDDSKGTNLDAVVQAVRTMKGPVILIAGGIDKGASYLLWKEPFIGKVKQIIAIGAAASKIDNELHGFFNIKRTDSLASAVDMAVCDAKRGDCVLLSPGCSSYDMFRSYAHRGEEFQRCVHSIKSRRES